MAGSPSFQWLKNLKSTQLKSLALALGITSSGTKSTLLDNIRTQLGHGRLATKTYEQGEVPQRSPKSSKQPHWHHQHEIISIDVGIRNLAFCHITLPAGWCAASSSALGDIGPEASERVLPVVHRWERLAVSSLEHDSTLDNVKDMSNLPQPDAVETNALKASRVEKPPTSASPSNPYDPLKLSSHALKLIYYILDLPATGTRAFKPDRKTSLSQEKLVPKVLSSNVQILIERQRFRTMGGPSVLEWTLRVNMFEAMLYAVLRTLQEMGIWGGTVHAVAPRQVTKFWLEHESVKDGEADIKSRARREAEKASPRKSSPSAATKAAKIQVVEHWLENVLPQAQSRKGDDHDHNSVEDNTHAADERNAAAAKMFELQGQAKATGLGFFQQRRRGNLRGKQKVLSAGTAAAAATAGAGAGAGRREGDKGGAVDFRKLDDLADCLLQGMAWIKWEEKRRHILSMGEAGL